MNAYWKQPREGEEGWTWEERYYAFQGRMLDYAASKLQDFLTSHKWPKLEMQTCSRVGRICVRVPNEKYGDALIDFLTKKTGAISATYDTYYSEYVNITIKPYYFVG